MKDFFQGFSGLRNQIFVSDKCGDVRVSGLKRAKGIQVVVSGLPDLLDRSFEPSRLVRGDHITRVSQDINVVPTRKKIGSIIDRGNIELETKEHRRLFHLFLFGNLIG